MGAIDKAFRKYMNNDCVFADIVNQMLAIAGSLVRVNPDELTRLDSSQLKSFGREWRHDDTINKLKNKSRRRQLFLERNRDAIRHCTFGQYGGVSSVLGIEVQAIYDRSMPIRVMVYESISLSNAWEDMQEKRRQVAGIGSAVINEKQTDDFIPSIYTCVLGIEGESADWPTDLHDITRFPVPEWKRLTSNVPLHVVTLAELARRPLEEFKSDLGLVARIIINADKDVDMTSFLDDEGIKRRISSAGADVIFACTGITIKLPKTKEVSMLTIRERVQKLHEKFAEENKKKRSGNGKRGRARGRARQSRKIYATLGKPSTW